MDQMEATEPGLIAQLKGTPTTKRYRYATMFMDHQSRLSYVHLMKTLTSEEMLEAKKTFETWARDLGVTIKHYHADNGRFADNAFISHVAKSGQMLSFCGVNAHWQNARAEKRIRDLQDQARVQLLHARHQWPEAITTALWPYAIRYANDVHNHTAQVGQE